MIPRPRSTSRHKTPSFGPLDRPSTTHQTSHTFPDTRHQTLDTTHSTLQIIPLLRQHQHQHHYQFVSIVAHDSGIFSSFDFNSKSKSFTIGLCQPFSHNLRPARLLFPQSLFPLHSSLYFTYANVWRVADSEYFESSFSRPFKEVDSFAGYSRLGRHFTGPASHRTADSPAARLTRPQEGDRRFE